MEKKYNNRKQENTTKERNNHKSYTPKKHATISTKEMSKYLLCIDNNEDSYFTKNKKYPLMGCKSIKGKLKFIIKDDNNMERYIELGSSEAKFKLESEVKPRENKGNGKKNG